MELITNINANNITSIFAANKLNYISRRLGTALYYLDLVKDDWQRLLWAYRIGVDITSSYIFKYYLKVVGNQFADMDWFESTRAILIDTWCQLLDLQALFQEGRKPNRKYSEEENMIGLYYNSKDGGIYIDYKLEVGVQKIRIAYKSLTPKTQRLVNKIRDKAA
ncbi:MAG: hypothetical protein NC230_07065 [Bacteroides sp.]|nr:hypothetical protein [Bacteroides sp.]MCM1413881.1 hypothetical protein [Bacteroides sp.]